MISITSYAGVIMISSAKAMISISPVTEEIGIRRETAVITINNDYILSNNIG
jgi:hypothetical protein